MKEKSITPTERGYNLFNTKFLVPYFHLLNDLLKQIVTIRRILADIPSTPRLVKRKADALISSEHRKVTPCLPVIFKSWGTPPPSPGMAAIDPPLSE